MRDVINLTFIKVSRETVPSPPIKSLRFISVYPHLSYSLHGCILYTAYGYYLSYDCPISL